MTSSTNGISKPSAFALEYTSLAVGPLAINVQLDKEEGGLLLTMPAESITEIQYTPVAPPATAQQAKAP